MFSEKDPIKQVKSAGQSIEIVGLFTALLNLVLFVFVLTGKIGISMSLLNMVLAGVSLLSVVIGVIYIVIGGKIRKDPAAPSNKKRLIFVAVTSAIILAANLFNGKSSSLILPMILLAMSLVGLKSLKKIQAPPQNPTVTQ